MRWFSLGNASATSAISIYNQSYVIGSPIPRRRLSLISLTFLSLPMITIENVSQHVRGLDVCACRDLCVSSPEPSSLAPIHWQFRLPPFCSSGSGSPCVFAASSFPSVLHLSSYLLFPVLFPSYFVFLVLSVALCLSVSLRFFFVLSLFSYSTRPCFPCTRVDETLFLLIGHCPFLLGSRT